MCAFRSALFQDAAARNQAFDSIARGDVVLRRFQSTGYPVQILQRALQEVGTLSERSRSFRTSGDDGSPPDGQFGEETWRAVQAFQRNPGPGVSSLVPDGQVGKLTWAALDARLAPGVPVAPETVPDHVLFVRGQCNQFAAGQLGVRPDAGHHDVDPAHLPAWQREMLGPYLRIPDDILEDVLRTAFRTMGGARGVEAFDHWAQGRGGLRSYPALGLDVSEVATRGPTLRSVLNPVKQHIERQLGQQASLGTRFDFQVMSIPDDVVPRELVFNAAAERILYVLVLGIQALRIRIKNYHVTPAARTYQATLAFEIYDVFGYGGDNDIVEIPVPSAGELMEAVQAATGGNRSPLRQMILAAGPKAVKTLSWILQHDRSSHVVPPFTRQNSVGKYKPYVIQVLADVPIAGTF